MDEVQPKRQTLGLKQVPSYIQKLQELKNQVEPNTKIQGHRKPSKDGDDAQNKPAQKEHVPYYKREQVVKALQWLQKTFPKCFVEGQHRPLKININQDVFAYLRYQEASDDLPSISSVRKALSTYTRNRFYLQACTAGAKRIDLDGQEAEEMTADEAAYAAELDAKYAKAFKEKKALKKKSQNRKGFDRKNSGDPARKPFVKKFTPDAPQQN